MALSHFHRDPWFDDAFSMMRPLWRDMDKMMPRATDMRGLAIDVQERDDGFTVKADLPGYAKEDVKVNIDDGVLSINAERKREEETKTDKEWRQERFYGKVSRSLRLPPNADDSAVRATYENGVLSLDIGKRAIEDAPKPRQIEIA